MFIVFALVHFLCNDKIPWQRKIIEANDCLSSQFQREKNPSCWGRSMVTSSRHDNRKMKLRVYILYHKHKTERAK